MRRLLVVLFVGLLVVGTPIAVVMRGDRDGGTGRVDARDRLAGESATAPDDCELPDGETTLADANLGFAWRSFKAIDASGRKEREPAVTYSPYSAATALHMLANGADPGTDEQLLAAMCLRGMSLGKLDEQDGALIRRLEGGPEVTVANGIWTVPPFRPTPRIDTVIQDQFDGEVDTFTGPDQVNAWAARRTKGRIKDIMQDLPLDGIAMILANAITFDGTWVETFEDARPGPFWQARKGEDARFDVPMLRADRPMEYAFSEEDRELAWDRRRAAREAPAAFHAVRLPYQGGRFAMVVIVPVQRDGLDAVIASLGPDRWRALRDSFEQEPVALAMPKLDLQASRRIEPELFDLGVPGGTYNSLFEPKPEDPAHIEWVKQATFLQVDEQGTKAAAVTVGGVSVLAGGPVGVPVQADHPYLLAIEDAKSGELLLLSAVRDPRGDTKG